MTEFVEHVSSGALPAFLAALLIFGFAPGFVLRLIVMLYPKRDPRRRELLAELYAMRRIERPMWVAEQIETGIFEGIRSRRKARRRQGKNGRKDSVRRSRSRPRLVLILGAGSVAASSTAVGVVFALGVVGATGVVTAPRVTTPDSALTPAVASSFVSVGSGVLRPGSDVALSGTVNGLSQGHSVWLLSRSFSAASDYFLVAGAPVARADGRWATVDYEVGGASDLGSGFLYRTIDADSSCASVLARASGAGYSRRLDSIPPSCVVSAQSAVVRID